MKKISWFLLAVLLAQGSPALAHLGSPGVSYQGKAGNYDLLVNILPPDVIPGTASVSVFVENNPEARVSVQTFYYDAGRNGSVPPEPAAAVRGAPGWFTDLPWVMWQGTASFKILVSGPKGSGSVMIPVMAVVTANRYMPGWLGAVLLASGLLLFALLITIVSSGAGDALLVPGDSVSPPLRRRAARAGLLAFAVVSVCGFSVWHACQQQHQTYLDNLYRPIRGRSAVFNDRGARVLRLQVDSTSLNLLHQPFDYIVPDHGKLMHLILVKEKTLDAFAHLHPVRKSAYTFLVRLPPLPQGRYFLYGDVVSANGFSETIIDTVNLLLRPAENLHQTRIAASPDDAWLTGGKQIDTGGHITWLHSPSELLEAGKLVLLSFRVSDARGAPALLQPYMGMTGHAIVVRDDGAVYVHLHPSGNFAMASQQAMQRRMQVQNLFSPLPARKKFRDSIDRLIRKLDGMSEVQRNQYLMAQMGMNMAMPGGSCVVQFPYAFPRSGEYRLWVEVKTGGRILTGVFDAKVK